MEVLKQISIVLLISLYLVGSSVPTIVGFSFLVMQEKLVAEFCVQRNAEENSCQAKCHVKKTLQKQEGTGHAENAMIDFISLRLAQVTAQQWDISPYLMQIELRISEVEARLTPFSIEVPHPPPRS